MPTLDWIGKKAVEKHHEEVPYHLLKCDNSLSVGDPGSGNLIVQGDNLLALKALLPYYAGKIKCIYIDPPYNTGSEKWMYNDNVNSPEIRAWLEETLKGHHVAADDLSRHDKWLCMMLPRLSILHRMLHIEGVLLVSIDHNEMYHLRRLMNDIFGEQNFLGELVWEKSRKNDAKYFSIGHEYIVVYAKSKVELDRKNTRWREAKPGAEEIHKEYLRLRELYGTDNNLVEIGIREFYKGLPKNHASKKHSRYGNVDDRGVWRDDNMSWPGGGGPTYEVLHPITKKTCAVPEGGWRYADIEKMNEKIREGVVVFRKDHSEPPIRKTYLVRSNDSTNGEDYEGDDIGIQVMGSYFYRGALRASIVLMEIFGKKVFENPKDHEVIARLIRYCTETEDLVMDSFAGSGTTAHAVLQLNKEDGGNRKFILVEMDEKICREITAERVKRVSEGYTNAKGQKIEGLGGGFRYCTLGETLFDADGEIRKVVTFSDLARHVFLTETGEPLPKQNNGRSPLLGVVDGTAYYLLYNGILGDKRANGGNVLTRGVLAELPEHDGPKVIFGTGCRMGKAGLERKSIVFRQIPQKVKIK